MFYYVIHTCQTYTQLKLLHAIAFNVYIVLLQKIFVILECVYQTDRLRCRQLGTHENCGYCRSQDESFLIHGLDYSTFIKVLTHYFQMEALFLLLFYGSSRAADQWEVRGG